VTVANGLGSTSAISAISAPVGNPANASRSFTVAVGAGLADARLSFTKCSSLTLAIYNPGGSSVSTSGPSVVVLDSSLAAGSYTYQVSGARCSFTLTVTSPSP